MRSEVTTFRRRLAAALSASGYNVEPHEARLNPMGEKLEFLQGTGRYGRLLSEVLAANNKANLKSHLLEATFAYQFENAGMPLKYDVAGRSEDSTSVDFICQTDSGEEICVELRLVQQRQWITDLFEQQLREADCFGTTLDGAEDRAETLRLQRAILAKAVDENGKLIKFQRPQSGRWSVVAIEVSELHLGMIDEADCVLVAYGDRAVPEFARRQLLGLFQEALPDDPAHIHEVAGGFAPFRESIHGVLFLRKVPEGSPVNFDLEYLFLGNHQLITSEDVNRIAKSFRQAMEIWGRVRKGQQAAS